MVIIMAQHYFPRNPSDPWSVPNEFVKKNPFLTMEPEDAPLPTYEESKDRLPKPLWEGHDDAIACYDKVWQIAFKNLRQPQPGSGFVSNFIDTAFNGNLFMWDSSFIVLFGRYASHIFNFQKTLDNFYSTQHRDGFICREIGEFTPGDQWERDDPNSTGPNIMPWCEWEYYQLTGDKERLEKVFYPLLGYHKWLQLNRTWQDGSYWSTGFACGMDNQPRVDTKIYSEHLSHGHSIWVDACFQMVISGKLLIEMGKVLGHEEDTEWLAEEVKMLTSVLNDKLWCEEDAYYYDMWRTGLTGVKSVGAYWSLLADIVPAERLPRFIAHLDNPKEFKRAHRVPTLSADHPLYEDRGGYWKGGVWAPTNYMVLKGLDRVGYHDLAFDIGCNTLDNVVKVFNATGTVWENYAPEYPKEGWARPDFVGWTGIIPVAIMFEYVFGIKSDANNDEIVWRVNLTEKHGIEQYPFGGRFVDLICEAREDASAEPVITVKCDSPVKVRVIWNGGEKVIG
ncbi:MAG: glycoside hydrolase [Ruminococcaceae bacterium]|nr:glycoside hydrolase [Oscillospiraceae bacterium]